jgi:uncharacterized membrane protein HdeD (DUF308 family)
MSSMQPPDFSNLSAALTRSMHEHWGLFLAEGIILSLLGLAAIIVPPLAGIVTTIFLGWLFVVAGIVGIIATMRARQAPGFGWALLSALVALIAGGVLLWDPLQGLITLTYVLTAFFILDGLLLIVLAISHRSEFSGKWQWMMVNGVIDLVLAAIVISGMPGSLLWVLGLLVGIDMIFGGATLIAMALDARQRPA